MPAERHLVIKTAAELQKMRDTCKLAAETLAYAKSLVQPGISTAEVDRRCHEFITSRGAYPSPLMYDWFPKSICTSINNVVCHGIPTDHDCLEEGDLISVDVTVFRNGVHGDTCGTFIVGEPINEKAKSLVEVSRTALMAAISHIGPGSHLSEIGEVIAEIVDDSGFFVIPPVCGHGIGRDFHELPYVYHVPIDEPELILKPGMVFTIEPAVSSGSSQFKYWPDNWTAVTSDDSLCSQFEHTITITDHGTEILTKT